MKEHFYTPISLLKKTFRPGERSLSRQEVAHRLQLLVHEDEEAVEQLLQLALDFPSSPFREGNSRAIIEYHQQSQPLATHVYRIFQEMAMPLSEEQILRKLRSYNLISWSFTFDRLGLYGDHRFLQLADERWMLSEWDLANDDIYQYLSSQGTSAISIRDVPYLIHAVIQLPRKKSFFLPELDKRFVVDHEMIYIRKEAIPDEQSLTMEQVPEGGASKPGPMGDENISYMEVAAAMNNETLEMEQSIQEKTVVDSVIEDLTGALIKLEKRLNEMKEEVLSHFTSNDLESIKRLMAERDKNEKVLQKIKEIVEEHS